MYNNTDTRQLKRQNLMLAKLLALLLYPTMCYFLPPVMVSMYLRKEPEFLYRLLQISLPCGSITIVLAVLFHLKKYLFNFEVGDDLKKLFKQAKICFALVIISIFLLTISIDENFQTIVLIIGSAIFFTGVFLLYQISSKIAETRSVFVDGVEDFSRLHIQETNIVVEHVFPFYGFYAAFATPLFLYKMFSKAQKHAQDNGFTDGRY